MGLCDIHVADQLRTTDPKRLAWYLTSRGLTNEAYYAHQKVARFIGTNHVDTSARICHAPSTAGLGATVGCAATTCSYSDWIGADLIVFVGRQSCKQPAGHNQIPVLRQEGGHQSLCCKSIRRTRNASAIGFLLSLRALYSGPKSPTSFFQIHTGWRYPFFYGVIKHLMENNWINHEFIAQRTAGWEVSRPRYSRLPGRRWSVDSGLSKADMFRFAETFGKARHAIVVGAWELPSIVMERTMYVPW